MSSIGWWVSEVLPQRSRRTWDEIGTSCIPWISVVVFYTVLANIPYWIVERQFGFTPLGWFCIQYLTVGLLALVIPRVFVAVLLFTVMFADLLCGICLTFNLPMKECIENLRAADSFSVHRLLYAIAVSAMVLLAAASAALLPARTLSRDQRWRAAACLGAFALLILGADCISIRVKTGHGPVIFSAKTGDGVKHDEIVRLCRIPFIRLVRMQPMDRTINDFEEDGPASEFPIKSATAIAVREAGISPGTVLANSPDIVLVLLESWGAANDPLLRASLVEPYSRQNVAVRYQVIQGTVPFHGPTISGEARELCGSGIGFHLLNAPARDLESCLPGRLDALGYHTMGVHGLSGHMFNRSNWYKTIGFEEQWFHDQLAREGLPDCGGAFVGICDARIASWIARRLETRHASPIFLHWMTLNSHLPLVVPSEVSNGAPCDRTDSLVPDSPLCSWYQLVENVHRSVAELASGPLSRPTIFVVVGDHAPPFSDPAVHDRFSSSEVPYVILVPRQEHRIPTNMIAHNAAQPGFESSRHARQTP